MAQSRPAPAAGAVPDPGGPSWPLNGATTPAPMSIGGSPSSPAVASQAISRQGTSLPVNTPMTQSVAQLAGSSPAPAIQPVAGVGRWPVVGVVNDPGAARFPIGSTQAVGLPPDTATVAGGDPRALGSNFSAADADAPRWSQFNPTFNPNPGALTGGMSQIPGLYPGETPATQVNPNANPNPGAL
jgi:hypothetical protein